ncbi:MAG TPA: J domain-containing protein [Thermoanaerobaculia bacterium]|nr:J domain-containing protein [Thermoanaerobaculia bacterium]
MDLFLGVLMVLFGAALAGAFVVLAALLNSAEKGTRSQRSPVRGEIGVSILHHIAAAGGAGPEAASRLVRDHSSHRGVVERGIDLRNWAEAYARATDEQGRHELLESGVRIAVAMHPAIPLRQYNALLDLSFALGFHPDAMARLRARYRFEYVDYAKASRPREADRSGGAAPLFDRRTSAADRDALLQVLGLSGECDRPRVVSAYRRLAARHHPDRFHHAGPAEREAAARRFIEITEAYERLLIVMSADD